jgi:hypothetical protein
LPQAGKAAGQKGVLKMIHWAELKLYDGEGYEFKPGRDDTRIARYLEEFRLTDGMDGAFFRPIGAAHEIPHDAATHGPADSNEVDWSGFAEYRHSVFACAYDIMRAWDREIKIEPRSDDDLDSYVVLTCTAHGKPVWRVTEDLDTVSIDRFIDNPPPVRVLGPYRIGPNGYQDAREGVSNDPECNVDLDNPTTWFDDPAWISRYLGK